MRMSMFFSRAEYSARWDRVAKAMEGRGYENVLVWQRSAGTYDRVGDVYWLTNFTTNGTGQDPASETLGAPWTFSAVLLRRGREPELHTGLPLHFVDPGKIVCGELLVHVPNLMIGLAEYLQKQHIEGRVAVVGDDVLPGMYDRLLRKLTPQIEWISDESLLLEPQLIKSERELEAFRIGGDIATRALTATLEALIAGESGAEAAARAAQIMVRAGGGFHRIDINHGAMADRLLLSSDFYGYNLTGPKPGEIARAWIYGPIFEGYWFDPGRTIVCGNRPTPGQRKLLEGAVSIVDSIVSAVRPGKTARELGILGGAVAKQVGYYPHPQIDLQLLGHGLGTNFIPYLIPLGEGDPDPTGALKYDEPFRPGMVVAAEAFLAHPGVGMAGFEQNLIVTKSGMEMLTRTPMVFW